jgi:F-type H+-transporting ATPase subunit b
MELNPLKQIDPLVIVTVMIAFSITAVLLRKWFFLPYIGVMEERDMRLEEAQAALDEAERIVLEAEPTAAADVERAREEADLLMRQSREQNDLYRRETVDAAMAEVSTLLEKGRKRISQARESELASLRAQAVECVNLACVKLMGSADEESTATAVDKLLARRVH